MPLQGESPRRRKCFGSGFVLMVAHVVSGTVSREEGQKALDGGLSELQFPSVKWE